MGTGNGRQRNGTLFPPRDGLLLDLLSIKDGKEGGRKAMRRIAIDLTAEQAERLKKHFWWVHKGRGYRGLLAQVYVPEPGGWLPLESVKVYIGAHGTVLIVPLDEDRVKRWGKRYLAELKRISKKKP